MQIIVKNQDGDSVFVFDVEAGKASACVPLNDCAHEFLRALETTVVCAHSQYQMGTIRDFLIESSGGAESGNLTIRPGAAGHNGEPGGDVVVTNPPPTQTQACPDCKDGTQAMLSSVGPCTTCKGSMQVPVKVP